jgi:hypothetical protein
MIGSEKHKYEIAHWESKILMVTSSLSVIPIYYAFDRGLLFHGITSSGTYIFSILYWHNPIHGWRRNVDLLYAKYTFIVYLGSGICYVHPGTYTILFYVGAAAIAQSYLMTFIHPHIWIRYHVLFHILCIVIKTFILSQIPVAYTLYE